jgi:hypothetical protein
MWFSMSLVLYYKQWNTPAKQKAPSKWGQSFQTKKGNQKRRGPPGALLENRNNQQSYEIRNKDTVSTHENRAFTNGLIIIAVD